ncbi:pupal cuticle protein [Drosophila sulfurigaster albostrigata]|uniref:pupal cuticle protein n=1 Tax=Drosophila sulfurigaster albostrigata TaxID=89887 RepID=UPI002D21DD3C|nr:pupal cuticle protein [Drosophila sulfurigaster albostrigata]
MCLNLFLQLTFALLAIEAANLYVPDSDRNTQTLHNDLQVEPDGNYRYAYETSNGIAATQSGLGGIAVQGGSSWTSPEGTPVSVSYVADELGYYAVGDHIPKIPDYILRSLEYIRNHPYKVKDYYTGEVKTVAHDAEAFKVYTRNIHAPTTPRTRPSTTPKVVHLTHPPTKRSLRRRRYSARRQ